MNHFEHLRLENERKDAAVNAANTRQRITTMFQGFIGALPADLTPQQHAAIEQCAAELRGNVQAVAAELSQEGFLLREHGNLL